MPALNVSDLTPETGIPVSFSWSNVGGSETLATLATGDGTTYTVTGQTSQVHEYASAGTVTATLSMSNASGSDSDATPALVVTVYAPPSYPAAPTPKSDGTITQYTVAEYAGAGAKTNEIQEFNLPTWIDELSAGQVVKVYADDGSGGKGAVVPYQIDNHRDDRNGYRRLGKITAMIPSLASGKTDYKLHIDRETTSLPTGTAITLADVLALGGCANGLVKVTSQFSDGDYVLRLDDLLTSASTTFSKTGYYRAPDNWRSGPLCTEWEFQAAPRLTGTAHASGDGLNLVFSLSAYKAGTGAVSGGNPITALRVHVGPRNGDTERASGSALDLVYGLKIERAASLSDPTLITTDQEDPIYGLQGYDWSDPTPPTATITLTGSLALAEGLQAVIDVDLSAGSWPAHIIGCVIEAVSGGGSGYVYERTSSTKIKVGVLSTFGASSYTTGNWRIKGLLHCYNTEDLIPLWIGNIPTSYGLFGSHSNALVPTTTAHADYIASSRMIPNFRHSISDSANSLTQLDLAKVSGKRRPFMHASSMKHNGLTASPARVGDINPALGSTSDRADIAIIPGYQREGLWKPTRAEGRRKIFENAQHFALYQWFGPDRRTGTPTAGSLGTLPRVDGGRAYSWNGYASSPDVVLYGDDHGGGQTPRAKHPIFQYESAHFPSTPYLAGLLTGDLFWVRQSQRSDLYAGWMRLIWNNHGQGADRTAAGTASGTDPQAAYGYPAFPFGTGIQTREIAWTIREAFLSAAITPSPAKPSLCLPEAHATGIRVAKTAKALKDYGPGDLASIWGGEAHTVRHGNLSSSLAGLHLHVDGITSAAATKDTITGTTSGATVVITDQGSILGTSPGYYRVRSSNGIPFLDNEAYTTSPGPSGVPGAGVINVGLNAPRNWGIDQVHADAFWTMDYLAMVPTFALELGLGDANLEAFVDWMADWYLNYDDPGVVPDLLWGMHQNAIGGNSIGSYRTKDINLGGSITVQLAKSHADLYRVNALTAPLIPGLPVGFARFAIGSVTLGSNAVGDNTTMTFGTAYFTNGGSWYVGGAITEETPVDNGLDPTVHKGLAYITGITSGTVAQVRIFRPFLGTTGLNTTKRIMIPLPHPDDYAGEWEDVSQGNTNAYQAINAFADQRGNWADAVRILADTRHPSLAAAHAWMIGRTGWTWVSDGDHRRLKAR